MTRKLQTTQSHYTCDWENCVVKQKPFHKHHQIIRHMRTHTGEKPFECTYGGCGKKFARSDSLLEHARKHNGTPVDFHKMMEFSTQREQDAKHLNGLMLQLDTIQEHQQANYSLRDALSQISSGHTDNQRDPAGCYVSPPDTRGSPERAPHQGSNPSASHQSDMDFETSGVDGDDQRQKIGHRSMAHVHHQYRQQQDEFCQHGSYHSLSKNSPRIGPSMEERLMQKKRGHANTASLGLSRMDIRDDYGSYQPPRLTDFGRNHSRHESSHSHTPSLEYSSRDMYQRKSRDHSHTPSLEMPPIPGQMHRMDDRRHLSMQRQHYSQTETKNQNLNIGLYFDKEPTLTQYSSEDHGQHSRDAEPEPQEEKAFSHRSNSEPTTRHDQEKEHVDSPASNPTLRTPQLANNDESRVLVTTTPCSTSSPGLTMEKDTKIAVAVI